VTQGDGGQAVGAGPPVFFVVGKSGFAYSRRLLSRRFPVPL
jgi:hypothetical protein